MTEGKEVKEKTAQKTYRLPVGDIELIEALAKKRMLGSTPSAVVRTLLAIGLKGLVESEYVKKHQETLELLKK